MTAALTLSVARTPPGPRTGPFPFAAHDPDSTADGALAAVDILRTLVADLRLADHTLVGLAVATAAGCQTFAAAEYQESRG